MLSRALLTPGPLPPLSHFGVTLLRHAVATGLRFALYQLGLPVPESPPARVVRLRLYLDGEGLGELLAGAAGGPEVVAALLDPGGAGALPAAPRLRAALAFHRARLWLRPPRPPRPGPDPPAGAAPEELWRAFRQRFSRLLPAVNDALLAELLAALERRHRRHGGGAAAPVLGPAARRVARRGTDAGAGALARLGPPDPLLPDWSAAPEHTAAAARHWRREPLPPAHRLRGRFRETYRLALSRLAPAWRAFTTDATRRGILNEPEDAFFLPFDLADDLALPRAPAWLAAAVAGNRREHQSARASPPPPDLLRPGWETTATLGRAPEIDLTPVSPLA